VERPPQRGEGIVQPLGELRVRAELGYLLVTLPPEDRVRKNPINFQRAYGTAIPADAENPSEPFTDNRSVQEPKQPVLMKKEEEATERCPMTVQ
jgi:hypothetical protein